MSFVSNRLLLKMLSLASGLISRIIPRSKRIWVVGGGTGRRYADNSMHFHKASYAQVSEKVVWLTHSNEILEEVRTDGAEAHLAHSLKGLYYGFRAKWHIYDCGMSDTSPYSSRGAKQLNLWHGIPIKNISRLSLHPPDRNGIRGWLTRRNNSTSFRHLLHPNRKYLSHVSEPLGVSESNVLIANLPRNDVLINHNSMHRANVKTKADLERIAVARETNRFIVGYFPTWRTDGSDRFLGIDQELDFRRLRKKLDELHICLITKWHPCSSKEYQHCGFSQNTESISKTLDEIPNVLQLDFSSDINCMLSHCDIIITDYSSLMFDALFLDAPLVFVPYDMEKFKEDWGYFYQYPDFLPGPVAYNVCQFICLMESYCEAPGKFGSDWEIKRLKLRDEIFECSESLSKVYRYLRSV